MVRPVPTPDLQYEPYEWFSPEIGRSVRRAMITEVVEQIRGRHFTVSLMRDYMRNLCGATSVSTIGVESLPVMVKAFRVLRDARMKKA